MLLLNLLSCNLLSFDLILSWKILNLNILYCVSEGKLYYRLWLPFLHNPTLWIFSKTLRISVERNRILLSEGFETVETVNYR